MHVLGWGSIHIRPLFAKIPALLKFLKSLPPNQVFLFVDGYDVLVTGGPDETQEKFLQLTATSSADILYNAEPNCWPFRLRPELQNYGDYMCEEQYPISPTKWRYLNGGVWMSYVDAGIRYLEVRQ